jgi:hypothetical protein
VTGTLLALSLILLGVDDQPPMAVVKVINLTIDACIAVDQETVRQVMELEISDAHLLPASVRVRCVDGAQEIRISRPGSLSQEEVRTVHIAPVSENETPAERQARSRELALSIAEFVRWPGADPRPPQNLPPPAPPLPATVPEIAAVTEPATGVPDGRWQLGLLYAYERFAHGHSLMGGDVFVGSRLGRWYLVELRIGGRLGSDSLSFGEHLTTRAASMAAAAGLSLWSKGHVLGGALVLRAQGYLAQVRGDATQESRFTTGTLGALALVVEPRLMVALTNHLFLQASAAVGWVPQAIEVRIQGVEAQSISGVALSANLAGVINF